LQCADYVPFTTENCLTIYEKGFPDFSKKYKVIPPLLTIFDTFVDVENVDDSLIHIAYFGKFYQKIREPRAILDFYEGIIKENPEWKEKIKIHIFGDIFDVFQRELQKPYIVLHGLIPREQVALEMQKANILLNISNITDYQLPSKAPDYLFSGKPIVNVCLSDKDCFADFFKNYPLIFNWKNTNEDAKKGVVFIEKNKKNTVDKDIIAALCSDYTIEKVSKSYEILF
jgi:hypothetical protein